MGKKLKHDVRCLMIEYADDGEKRHSLRIVSDGRFLVDDEWCYDLQQIINKAATIFQLKYPEYSNDIAETQLEQQQKQADILKSALDRIWTSSMTAELAQQIAGTALAEWRMKEAE